MSPLQVLEVEQKRKAIPELSYESAILYGRLKTLKPDEFISYKELSDLIGRDVQKYRGPLTTAIRKCLTQDHIVIGSVRCEGVKRLPDGAVVRAQRKAITHIGTTARVAMRKLGAVEYASLTKPEQLEHNTLGSVLGTQAYFAKEPQIKKIQQKVEEASVRLPVGKTLDIFK